ncbi:MAG: ATP-dependent acyl-CoA ligase [Gammaproteobacteria bacterium]|nr:ATP-dependent acyl-CoA ligase [Gammaproteobacteria bacterium]
MNLSDLVADRARQYGDKAFLLFERQPVRGVSTTSNQQAFRQSLSFTAFNNRVNQACHYLSGLGIVKGDVINLHLPNCPCFLILWFAAARLSAVMMPTNVLASAEELSYLIEHSGSKIAFTTLEHMETLRQCQVNSDYLQQIVLCDSFSDNPVAETFEAQLQEQSETFRPGQITDTDMVAIMYTSGTTSKPKGVMVTHANYLTAGQTVADAIELNEDDRQFVVLPLFHGNAQYYSTMSALLCGASIALMDRFSASQYFDKCIEYQCTVASLFAAPMRMILAQDEEPGHRCNRLRMVIYAQNLTEQQLQEWQRRFDAPLGQIWGMTETMGPALMNPLHGERKNWTVGKPSGDYLIRLVDETGNAVNVGQEGEITVKGIPGKSIMSGYYKNPEATRDCIRKGWLYTGDNAIEDGDGFFRFIDRKKDMIKRSGENVSASEVENVLLQHPAVFECAVIGVPDELKDESIVAAVVLRRKQEVSKTELIEFCTTRLAKFRVPGDIVFQQSLPKTSVGKTQKHLIRKALIAAR